MSQTPVTLVANELDFSYGRSQVLHDIALEIRSGERLGIVGESGSGKTTLANLLVGVLNSDQVTVNGKPWSNWPRQSGPRRAVQLVQQDPFASLTPHISARSAVAEAARVTGQAHRREAGRRAAELLNAVGIGSHLAARRPGALSGGQCQRISIARALAAGPSILFADEPTSSLDLSVQAQIINLLLALTKDSGLGLVLVSHDLAVIRHLTARVIVMRHGRVVEEGRTSEVLRLPQHEYTQMLCKADLAQHTDHHVDEFAEQRPPSRTVIGRHPRARSGLAGSERRQS
jgi:ABC-type dipeptide/oligopeptide/nickel transport system ATPase subunit